MICLFIYNLTNIKILIGKDNMEKGKKMLNISTTKKKKKKKQQQKTKNNNNKT